MIKSVKMGKHGPEVSFHDKLQIMDRIVKLCGFEPKQPGDAENPLHLLIQSIQGSTLKVRSDEELRAARLIDHDQHGGEK
jgi:hypothetical protein